MIINWYEFYSPKFTHLSSFLWTTMNQILYSQRVPSSAGYICSDACTNIYNDIVDLVKHNMKRWRGVHILRPVRFFCTQKTADSRQSHELFNLKNPGNKYWLLPCLLEWFALPWLLRTQEWRHSTAILEIIRDLKLVKTQHTGRKLDYVENKRRPKTVMTITDHCLASKTGNSYS